MTDLREVAIGDRTECDKCGETLVRTKRTEDEVADFIEVASGEHHGCWTQLPENAEHLRLD